MSEAIYYVVSWQNGTWGQRSEAYNDNSNGRQRAFDLVKRLREYGITGITMTRITSRQQFICEPVDIDGETTK